MKRLDLSETLRDGEPQPLRIISCGILKHEIRKLIQKGKINAEARFLPKNLHSDPVKLEKTLDKVLSGYRVDGGPRPVLVYGDVCMGFDMEIKALVEKHEAVKVDALNCIDCLLGGGGELLRIDPEHVYLFLTTGFIEFTERIMGQAVEETRKMFSMLKGITLIDALGDLEQYRNRIEAISDRTGLPILETRKVGLDPLRKVLSEAIERAYP